MRGSADWTRIGALVSGAVIAIGSCLRWLTLTGALTGPIAIETRSGLHDLGYATDAPINLGDLTLLLGCVVLIVALASGRKRLSRRSLVVVALTSAGALIVSVAAAWSILSHEATRPPGANVDFHTSAGIWITLAGAVVGLATASVGIARFRRAAVLTS